MLYIRSLIQNVYFDYKRKNASEKVIYYVEVNSSVSGFFALLRAALDYCCFVDEKGFLPYIKYGRNTLYSEKRFFLGTNNPFEYYFVQPISAYKMKELFGISVIKSQPMHMDEIELRYNDKPISYLVENKYIDRMSEVYRNYIHLNKRTQYIVQQKIKNILDDKKTLGVHIRGTDFYKAFNNHPVPVQVDEYIEAINKEVDQYHYQQVFIATDDARCLKELKERISIPLVYYKSTKRAISNKSVAFSKSDRKNNNYTLGLEVLVDAYTLASCQGFIGCLSQVDIFVQIIKKSKGKKFDSLCIINKGIYNNNRQCWEPNN